MNAQVTVIEPESLQYVPAKTLLRVVEATQNAKKWTALFQSTVNSHPGLFRWLEEQDLDVRFSLSDGDMNLSFTGDGPRLGKVWGELRRNGYVPNTHPEKGKAEFYTHWLKEGCATFWMNFSSSVCRRVQVGTQTVVQPIYEVQCGEMPEMIETASTAPVLHVVDGGADDIPF
jgi:hypothetical protein